ncbi:MAG: hypothetical protein ACKVQW_13545 [Pyrinomonadaceae bacterium]
MKLTKTLRVTTKTLITLFFLASSMTLGQETPDEPPYTVEADANACELNRVYLDLLLGEAKKDRENKELIFVISRLGRTESYRLNRVRLVKAKDALTFGKDFSAERVITAIGDRLADAKAGHLEFYLGGKLFLISKAPRNKRVCLSCCPV